MNPIVGIENDTHNHFLILNIFQEDKSMIPKTLFDMKYENLKDTFIIHNENKVYSFIKNNKNLIKVLEEVKPCLSRYFHDQKYHLEVRCYPEIYEDELALIIMADYSKEDIKNLHKRLMKVDTEIRAYKIELGLLGKFFIDLEGI
jgi:hypothetical protein